MPRSHAMLCLVYIFRDRSNTLYRSHRERELLSEADTLLTIVKCRNRASDNANATFGLVDYMTRVFSFGYDESSNNMIHTHIALETTSDKDETVLASTTLGKR